MATVTEKQIADQAAYVEEVETHNKAKHADDRQTLKDARKLLSKLVRERKSGQMTIDMGTGEVKPCPHDRVNMAGKCQDCGEQASV
jgi:hypothetical protein